jgi:phenylalanyl-tRNA synthetase beta subunit
MFRDGTLQSHGRLFWSADERFLKQFRGGGLATRFKPYSKFPPCFKDVSFWTSPEFSENNLCEVVRSVAGADAVLCDLLSLATCTGLAMGPLVWHQR